MLVIIVAIVIVILFLVYVFIQANMVYKVQHPKIRKNVKKPSNYDMEFREFETITKDRLHIKGWFIPNESGNKGTLVLSHNIGANMSKLLSYAKFLHSAGYHIVMYDAHSHGDSERDNSIFFALNKSKNDLLAVIDSLKQEEWFKKSNQEIALLGYSFGTISSCWVYAMMPEIKAIILDCGPFMNYVDAILNSIKRTAKNKKIICEPLIKLILQVTFNGDYIKKTEKAITGMEQRPVFLIHGEKDFIVPVEDTKKFFDKIISDKKEYWLVPDSYHLTAYSINKSEYEGRVLAFLDKYMA